MSLIESRHVHVHRGHRIEIIEDGVAKRVRLSIDGREVASESCILPQTIVLEGELEGATVRAEIEIRLLRSSVVSLAIDGQPAELQTA